MDNDEIHIKLFVMDTGPLLTLAAAKSLDYLLLPNVPVCIADAVFYEATVKFEAIGAQDIMDWAKENSDRVHIVPTHAYAETIALLEALPPEQRRRSKNLGERAAVEVITDALTPDKPQERGVLVTEDDRALRASNRPPLDQQVLAMTTHDFLSFLESEGRINSAEQVYIMAEDAGRFASQQKTLLEADEKGMEAVRRVFQKAESNPKLKR